MSTVILWLPDNTCQRLKQLAASRGISLNRLMEELGTAAIAAHARRFDSASWPLARIANELLVFWTGWMRMMERGLPEIEANCS